MNRRRPGRIFALALFGGAACIGALHFGTSDWAAEEQRAADDGTAESEAAAASGAVETPAARRLPPRGAYRETVHYEPSKCSPPVTDGKVWIMLGRLVLAWPSYKVAVSIGLSREEVAALPVPPDPLEPEGCPKNPMWGSTFSLTFPYPSMTEDGSEQVEWASTGLVYAQSGRAYVQESNEKITERKCNEAPPGSIREVLPSGFTVCRYKPAIEWPVESWGTSFVAPLDLYSMPDGRPFIVSCLSGELTSGPHGCPVSYRLYEKANVFYKVNFQRTSIDEVITMDKALRSAIEDAVVSDYAWPDGKQAEPDLEVKM